MEAVELTLERDPNIEIARSRLEASRGSLLIASAFFDPNLSVDLDAVDSKNPTGTDTFSESRVYSQQASWLQRLRSGQILQPTVSLDQTADASSDSTGTLAFSFRQPLLRGRDPKAVTASEDAARRELEAARLDLLHRVGQRIALVANVYWSARSALLDLKILQETEKRSRELLDNTRRLVAADLTPAADLIQLEADLVFREASTLAAERSLSEVLQQLGAEIGLNATEIQDLAVPVDGFPRIEIPELPAEPDAWLATAEEHRADLSAAKERLRGTELRLLGAEDDLKPRLDFVLVPSYTGFVDGRNLDDAFSALTRNIPGASATVGLSYSFPLGNRSARGVYIRAEEAIRQQRSSVELQQIGIGADVLSSFEAVKNGALRLEKLERAVELFSRSLANEEKKLRAGSSTIIDVLNQRDRLTSAQQRLVAARRALAQAIVDLRFDTGTLVETPSLDDRQQLPLKNLTTLPTGAGE